MYAGGVRSYARARTKHSRSGPKRGLRIRNQLGHPIVNLTVLGKCKQCRSLAYGLRRWRLSSLIQGNCTVLVVR